MKRLLVVVFTLSLVLAVSASAFAAVHHEDMFDVLFMYKNNSITDTWYTTNFWPPHITAGYTGADPLTGLGADFFLNDQMFAGVRSLSGGGGSQTLLKGSYLFDFGLFVGVNSLSGDIMEGTIIAPGYRLSLGDFNYVTFSADFDTEASEIMDFDVDAFYVKDPLKFKGEVVIPQSGGDTMITLDVAYKVSDPLCVGATVISAGDTSFSAGVTYTGVEKLILDGQFGSMAGTSALGVSGMYSVTQQIRAGAEYVKIGDGDGTTTLKMKYGLDEKSYVVFKYSTSDPAVMTLVYEKLMLP